MEIKNIYNTNYLKTIPIVFLLHPQQFWLQIVEKTSIKRTESDTLVYEVLLLGLPRKAAQLFVASTLNSSAKQATTTI